MFQDDFKQRYTTIPFAIYRAFRERGEKEVLSHQHKEVELISVTEGCADFYIDSQHYRAQPGDVLVISPYAIHRAQTSQSAFTSYFCICFDLELLCDRALKKQLEDHTLSGTCLISADQSYASALADCIKTAYFACVGNATGWELEAVGHISLLFGILKKQGCLKKVSHDDHRRNFGKEAAMYAGLGKAEGEYVTLIDADLQQRPEIAVDMVEFLDNNPDFDCVAAYQAKRNEGFVLSFFKKCFYNIIN